MNMDMEHDDFREDISPELIPRKGNEDLLENAPHEDVGGDMAMISTVRDEEGNSQVVTNEMAQEHQLTKEEITDAAHYNLDMQPYSLQTMPEALGMDPNMEPEGVPQILVLSNESGHNGAVEIMNDSAMDEAAERLGGSKEMYVIPSSRHETLLLDRESCEQNGMSVESVDQMIRDINASEVSPEDRLSDHVYTYDTERHELKDPHMSETEDRSEGQGQEAAEQLDDDLELGRAM